MVRRMTRWRWAAAGVLVPATAVAVLAWPRTEGSATETAEAYLSAWSAGDYAGMRALVDGPPADFERRHRELFDGLRLDTAAFAMHRTGGVFAATPEDLGYATFTARLTGPGPDLDYEGTLNLVERDGRWKVAWTPATIHPDLRPGRTLVLDLGADEDVPLLAADGGRWRPLPTW